MRVPALSYEPYRIQFKFLPDKHEKLLHIIAFKCPLRKAKILKVKFVTIHALFAMIKLVA